MMLGPMKKRMVTTGVIAFIIPTIIAVGVFMAYSNKKNEEIAELKVKAATVEKYIATGDLPIGHIITASDIEIADVKGISAPVNSFDGVENLIGQKLKVPVFKGTIMTSSMFYELDDFVREDVRRKEFNMISLPSDLVEGDYIDVRIIFPTGEDYVVVAGKEVKKVGSSHDSNAIFLDLTEEEINRMSSAVIESYVSGTVRLYAVKYSNWYEQLYDEESVDFVKRYEETVEALIEASKTTEEVLISGERVPVRDESGEKVRNESGEILFTYEPDKIEIKEVVKKEEELEDEEIAIAMNLDIEDVKAIRTAKKTKDKVLLALYSNKSVLTETKIEDTYPVRPEVALLIQQNPNILEEIDAKYNVEELELRRITLIASGMYGFGEEDDGEVVLENIKTKLDEEIATQKTERSEYLQSIIRAGLVESQTKAK